MEKQIKTVFVGCGGISRVWLAAIKDIPHIEIAGFVDLDKQAAQSKAEAYGWHRATVGTDLDIVLEQINLDAVFDCTIPKAHVQVVLTALRHGCHVLGEKPMADSMANARKMVAAAQAAGKIYAVIQNQRYTPNIRRLRNFLASGVIGPITTVNSDFYIGAHFGGFRDQMEHVLLLDMAVHTFDAARFIANADPVAVYCKEWNPPGSWYDHDASAVAVFEMTNGIVYTYRGSWCTEGLNTTWESNWRIVGTKGSVTWDGDSGFKAQVVTETGSFFSELADLTVPPYDSQEKVGGHTGLIREFVHCVQTNTIPETICADNIDSLAMVFGAIESAETGKRIVIETKGG